MPRDWVRWHEGYDGGRLEARLEIVQARIRDALDACDAGPIRVVSLCAGQGRDLLGVLPMHARRDDVRARLVELDPTNVEAARVAIGAAGLENVDVVEGDAAHTSAYAGAVPAQLVLACGVFGNVSDDDVARTVHTLPMFCTPGATMIWTRHHAEPDLTPQLRAWCRGAGFDEIAFDTRDGYTFSVGAWRYAGTPVAFDPDVTMFTFRDDLW